MPKSLASFLIRLIAAFALASTLTSGAWAGSKYKVLHNFTGGLDGGGLLAGVILDSAGNVYGATHGGGAHLYGTAFELSLSGGEWVETVLYNFCADGGGRCTDGQGPANVLAFDQTGNLYGTAYGGTSDHGVIFELSPGSSGWSYNVPYEMGSQGGVVLDPAGDLYGIIGPGAYHAGAVAELSPGSNGWTYTELYSFDPQKGDGFITENPLVFDESGNLYGTTKDGGAGGYGNVFEVSRPETFPEWTERILHAFPAFKGDGKAPYAGLVFDGSGNLYGATESGGTVNQTCPQGCGTIYKLTPDGHGRWKETILHRFPKFGGGLTPLGTLAFDQSGNIYGTTAGGGGSGNVCFGGCGTVFKMTPGQNGTWTYTVLHRFTGNDGANPQAGVAIGKQGNIYGTTVQGGSGYDGVVFEIIP